ncbi:MAG: periplasmic heavy metal sensor [Albidovulum sp.]|nr:periplasmic heavy metal sensor [Albidovulum sp.]
MENSNGAGKEPKSWLRILLIGSLCLNLLVVGGVIGAALKWRGGVPKSDFGSYCGSAGMTAIVRAMDRNERAAVRDAFEASGFGRDFRRSTAREDVEGLIEILKSDPLDIEALKSKLVSRSEQLSKALETGNGILVDRIESLPLSERLRIAERISERHHRHKR